MNPPSYCRDIAWIWITRETPQSPLWWKISLAISLKLTQSDFTGEEIFFLIVRKVINWWLLRPFPVPLPSTSIFLNNFSTWKVRRTWFIWDLERRLQPSFCPSGRVRPQLAWIVLSLDVPTVPPLHKFIVNKTFNETFYQTLRKSSLPPTDHFPQYWSEIWPFFLPSFLYLCVE